MPCYTPLPVCKLPDGSFKFGYHLARDAFMRVSCGQCIGCLLRKSRDWAVRGVHHSMMCPRDTCHFLTLTFSPENMPRHPVTGREYFVDGEISAFMKRLRKNTGQVGVKYFACREYGERTFRPHYHICLFGLRLDDYKFYKRSVDGFPLFNSDVVSQAWQYRGHAVVAPMTFHTMSYTARYTTKKIGSKLKPGTREYATDILTGEVWEHLPERTYVSNRPGLAFDFFNHYQESLLSLGSTIIGNRRYPLPAYYVRLAKESGSDFYAEYDAGRAKYYQNAEYFDDYCLLQQMRDKLLIVDRMVRSVV